MTYYQALSLLRTAKNKSLGKPIGNNTRIFDRGTHLAIQYHSTDIINLYPNGIKLYTGGWRTVTTKQRINKYSPVKVYQKNHVWYFLNGGEFKEGVFIPTGKLGEALYA